MELFDNADDFLSPSESSQENIALPAEVLVSLIFLNFFIAIILEGYSHTVVQNKKWFNFRLRSKFRRAWSYYDQDATGYILVEDFPRLMMRLREPLGWSKCIKEDPIK